MLFLGTSGVSSSTFCRKTKLTLAETLRFMSHIDDDSDFDDLDDEIFDGDNVPKINNLQDMYKFTTCSMVVGFKSVTPMYVINGVSSNFNSKHELESK